MAKAKEQATKPDISIDENNVGNTEQTQNTSAKIVVLKEFRDANNWAKVYHVGEDISGLSKGRIAHLIKIGYAK